MLYEEDIKVSIVTVSYNEVNTIEQTMQSVFNQTYDNIEYIVIDGNSTDGTQSVIEKYKDRLAYYVSEPDSGLYEAMNKGIQRATGNVIGMINADDWYEADTVEKAVSCFRNTDAEIVHTEIRYISENGKEKCSERRPLSELWYHNVVQHPSVFADRELYKKYGLFNLQYHILADYDLMLRWYEKGVKFVHVDGIVANFRRGGISTSVDFAFETIEELRNIALSHSKKCFDYAQADLHDMIESFYVRTKTNAMLRKEPQILEHYLIKQYPGVEKGMYIFGSGERGEYCLELLNKTYIPLIAFIDNNSKKWGTDLNGISIKNPNILRNGRKIVLISVKDYAEDIANQLKSLKNDEMIWFDWEEILYSLSEQVNLAEQMDF